jgi:hypothetical protein
MEAWVAGWRHREGVEGSFGSCELVSEIQNLAWVPLAWVAGWRHGEGVISNDGIDGIEMVTMQCAAVGGNVEWVGSREISGTVGVWPVGGKGFVWIDWSWWVDGLRGGSGYCHCGRNTGGELRSGHSGG